MILKGFKEKSNENYINKILKSRVIDSINSKTESIGVIVNKDETIDVKWFDDLAETLKINPNNFQVITFTKEKKIGETAFSYCFNEKNIGWKGSIKNQDLKSFLTKEFDVLISYYTEASTELRLLTATSKSKFKVGVLQDDERLNDLIIKTELKDYKTFETELLKYLSILKKI